MTDQQQTADDRAAATPAQELTTAPAEELSATPGNETQAARPDGSAAAPFPAPPFASPGDDPAARAAAAAAAGAASAGSDRPEMAVGAAFAGGFVLALILRRLAR